MEKTEKREKPRVKSHGAYNSTRQDLCHTSVTKQPLITIYTRQVPFLINILHYT